jgi:recombination protein RecT
VANARLGLDAAQKNHIHPIPYKNGTTGKYDIGFIKGYEGIEYIAKKYAIEVPEEVICEIVYETDTFKPIKRGGANTYDSYDFEINNPFDRGEVVGGFAYFIYENPKKNRLMIMSKKEIEKRKPKYASAEFWGGEKDKWENGKKVGKEQIEGWYEQMVLKTIKRAAYSSLAIDPQKIDDNYQYLKRREREWDKEAVEAEAEQEVEQNANKHIIDVDTGEIMDAEYEDVSDEGEPDTEPPAEKESHGVDAPPQEEKKDSKKQGEPRQASLDDGPDY